MSPVFESGVRLSILNVSFAHDFCFRTALGLIIEGETIWERLLRQLNFIFRRVIYRWR